MLDPCWHHFSLLGASWAHFVLLVAFVVVFGWFLCVLGRSCSILEASKRVRRGFWMPQGLIFRGFFARARMQCEKGPTGVLYWKNQYETHVGHPAHDAKKCWEPGNAHACIVGFGVGLICDHKELNMRRICDENWPNMREYAFSNFANFRPPTPLPARCSAS